MKKKYIKIELKECNKYNISKKYGRIKEFIDEGDSG